MFSYIMDIPCIWKYLYTIAADIPERPTPKIVRVYYDFFKTLSTVIPDADDRRAYRKITSSGPFKIQSKIFESGPEKALQWVIDVRQGMLLSQGKPMDTVNALNIWKNLKYTRSNRNPQSPVPGNDESLNVPQLKSTQNLDKVTRSGKVVVVLFDKPHYLLVIPGRSDKQARLDLAAMKARFGVDALWIPGNLSYRWWFSLPQSTSWKERTAWKFPLFRVYKDGKIIVESNDSDDIKRYLNQRAMKNAPPQYISYNKNRTTTVHVKHNTSRGVMNSFAEGFAGKLGRRAASFPLM